MTITYINPCKQGDARDVMEEKILIKWKIIKKSAPFHAWRDIQKMTMLLMEKKFWSAGLDCIYNLRNLWEKVMLPGNMRHVACKNDCSILGTFLLHATFWKRRQRAGLTLRLLHESKNVTWPLILDKIQSYLELWCSSTLLNKLNCNC